MWFKSKNKIKKAFFLKNYMTLQVCVRFQHKNSKRAIMIMIVSGPDSRRMDTLLKNNSNTLRGFSKIMNLAKAYI